MKTRWFNFRWLRLLLLLLSVSHGYAELDFLDTHTPTQISPYTLRTWRVAGGLPFNQIKDVLQRKNGFIWVATINGAARFDGISFETFNTRTSPELPNNRICKLYEDAAGTLFLGHDTGHISVRRNSEFQQIEPSRELIKDPVVDFVEEETGTVWAIYKSGKWRPVSRDGNPIFYGQSGKRPADIRLLPGKNNGWTEQNGHVIQILNGTIHKDLGPSPWGLKQDICFLELANGDVVAGMTFGGLYILHKNGDITRLTTGNDLASNTILCLHEDREGTLWIGTSAGLQSFRFNRYSGIREGTAYRFMSTIVPRKSGEIWIGTNLETLHVVTNGIIKQLDKPQVLNRGIRVMLEDREGKFWTNTDAGFLLCLDQTGCNNVYPVGGDHDIIWALHEDATGILWAGGHKGLWRKDADGWHSALSTKDGITDIRCIESTPDGTLWFGMESEGLASIRDGKLKRIPQDGSLSNSHITTLYFDESDDTLWIGTCGSGLLQIRDAQLSSAALTLHTITQIIDDTLDRLWLLTEKGIAVIEKDQLRGPAEQITPLMIDKNEGVNLTMQIDDGATTACRHEDGSIWVIAGKKLLTFQPEDIKRDSTPVQILIRNIRLNNKVYAVNEKKSLTLPPGVHRMDINFSALSYCAPRRINFRCRMVGLNDNWIELGSRRFSSYQHLKPGKYRFELLAANRDGVWNPTPETLLITVQPQFWETWWFKVGLYVIGSVCLVLLSLGVAERINRRKLIRAEKMQAVEQERTRIAMDIHDEIGSELTRMSMLSHRVAQAFSKNDLCRAPSQVNEMEHVALKLIRALDEIVWVVSPINDTLDNLVAYISKYTAGILHKAGISCNIDLPTELPKHPMPGPVRHDIFLAVKEAVNNAIKHSEATQITLRTEMLTKSIRIALIDNGKGLAAPQDERFQNGLKNMQKRMELAGGRFSILKNKTEGTTVEFYYPVPKLGKPNG
jgi:signal transduction histidine kinase/ligand-binding sensor domain-containing protein